MCQIWNIDRGCAVGSPYNSFRKACRDADALEARSDQVHMVLPL